MKEAKHKRVHTEWLYLKFKTTILTSTDERGQNSGAFGGIAIEKEPKGGCRNVEVPYILM